MKLAKHCICETRQTFFQMMVERDNIRFMREKERSLSASAASSLFGPSTSKSARKKDDDQDEDGDGLGGHGSVRGCGGSDFNTPGRFIC